MVYDPGMPVSGGPYLSIAVFCEKVLRESDNVMTLVRIVDRWNITGPTETIETPVVIQATLVVVFKSGTYRSSTSKLTITPRTPSGVALPELNVSALFEGDDDRGLALTAPLGFPVQEPGIYWFEVAVDGVTVTHIPLRVVYRRIVQAPIATQKPPG